MANELMPAALVPFIMSPYDVTRPQPYYSLVPYKHTVSTIKVIHKDMKLFVMKQQRNHVFT